LKKFLEKERDGKNDLIKSPEEKKSTGQPVSYNIQTKDTKKKKKGKKRGDGTPMESREQRSTRNKFSR